MRDALYVKSVLDNIITSEYKGTPEGKLIYNARVTNLEWAYNEGNLRTEGEIETKIQSIKEELIACEFAGDRGINYKTALSKLKDLNGIL